jgi:hypothetical protein
MIRWLQVKDVPAYIEKQIGLYFSEASIYYWITKGRKSESGQTILLKATKKLGTWLTTEKWVDKFIEDCSK